MNWSAAILLFPLLAASAATAVDFKSQIEPVLAKHCYKCHGTEKQKGGLRLDSPLGIRKGGDSGEPLLIPGNSTQSHLVKLVGGIDPDETMPPNGKNPVSPEDLALLKSWIDEGADLPGSPEEIPITTDHWSFQKVVKGEPPATGSNPWGTGAVDAFISDGLRKKNLQPSPPADRRTLIRRLHLVAHGLPPTPDAVEAFVADTSPDAWEKRVDRALASPRFGERWARHWLDIVRFAESNGFETNRERLTAYHFRDYTIRSLNEDKPYDQFIREQLAGDAFGAPVGTGFLVAGPFDIVKSPDVNLTLMQRQDELADIINTTGTAFLGLTLGCARCHNHKFDPVSQKDYYAMQAVFAGVKHGERAMPKATTEEERGRLDSLEAELAAVQRELESLRSLASKRRTGDGAGTRIREPVNASGNTERFPPTQAKSVRFTIRRTSGGQPCIDELRVFDRTGKNVALAKHGAKPSASGTLPGYAIHKLEHINDGLDGNSHSWISNTDGGGWIQIEFPEIASIERVEWARDRHGRFQDRVAIDYRIESSEDGKNWTELASSADRQPFGGAAKPDAFLANLEKNHAERGRQLLDKSDQLAGQISALRTGVKAWIGTFGQPGPTHRLYRGDPMAKREPVAPDALEVLGSLGMKMDEAEQRRRIKLAEWIADQENPLTARVMVNRLWQYTFGTGIVDTPSDFGANGTPPTHPELLDWLAAEFVENGWSVKHILRLLLTSETFQQSSLPSAGAEKIDAGSRYLWRFPPRRLEAEAIRDSILAAAGTLDLRMGGPGFYLLDVQRENVVHYFPKETTGPPEWRRMVYMFKVRQEKDAVFGAFDCPDGNQVIPKRSRSTTPLQALNLFNSRFVIQQAEKLAQRVREDKAPVARTYALLYGRTPTAGEHADAETFIGEYGLEAFCRAMLNTNEFLFIF